MGADATTTHQEDDKNYLSRRAKKRIQLPLESETSGGATSLLGGEAALGRAPSSCGCASDILSTKLKKARLPEWPKSADSTAGLL